MEYNYELTKTAAHLYELEKAKIERDEMRDGTYCFTVAIDAFLKEEDKEQ